jgi:predicted dehydrogenase
VTDGRALVVGAGSIGIRHRNVLEGLGLATGLVSRRAAALASDAHPDLVTGVGTGRPAHVVIATETSAHLDVLDALAETGFTGTVVVEKPLTHRPAPLAAYPFRAVAVGYQLRLHPAVEAARELLAGDQILAVDAYVGQHLADWRPGRAVGDSASARTEDGGGALRDLSHELDLVTWLAGAWRRVCATGGRSGVLGPDVATDDRWAILLELESGAVATVHLNALDHVGQRRLCIVGARTTVAVDLVGGTTQVGPGGQDIRHYPADRDVVLARLHRAVMDDPGDGTGATGDSVCSLEQGMAVVALIDAIERSVRDGGWIARGPSSQERAA